MGREGLFPVSKLFFGGGGVEGKYGTNSTKAGGEVVGIMQG